MKIQDLDGRDQHYALIAVAAADGKLHRAMAYRSGGTGFPSVPTVTVCGLPRLLGRKTGERCRRCWSAGEVWDNTNSPGGIAGALFTLAQKHDRHRKQA